MANAVLFHFGGYSASLDALRLYWDFVLCASLCSCSVAPREPSESCSGRCGVSRRLSCFSLVVRSVVGSSVWTAVGAFMSHVCWWKLTVVCPWRTLMASMGAERGDSSSECYPPRPFFEWYDMSISSTSGSQTKQVCRTFFVRKENSRGFQ